MVGPLNSTKFELDDLEDARGFFDEHGFVVVKDVLAEDEVGAISAGWDAQIAEACREVDLSVDEFIARFPQNRDLWMKSDVFRRLLFESRQADVAASLLGVSSVRLFHDHAIAKPSQRSSTIPWHQDNAYWPVDRAGLSLWTPTNDVGEEGGCLTVLDGSHRDGPGVPQDFLASQEHGYERDPRLVHLPVKRGETVVLHGLTWHCSMPNVSEVDRLAYLSLWIPGTARYEPKHADWHPTARFIDVEPGERVEGESFPLFGELTAHDEGEAVSFPPPTDFAGPSMFKAGKDIAAQIAWLVGQPSAPLSSLLEKPGAHAIARAAVATGITRAADEDALVSVLEDLALQEEVRKNSVARDVYLETVSRWWSLAGFQIMETRAHG